MNSICTDPGRHYTAEYVPLFNGIICAGPIATNSNQISSIGGRFPLPYTGHWFAHPLRQVFRLRRLRKGNIDFECSGPLGSVSPFQPRRQTRSHIPKTQELLEFHSSFPSIQASSGLSDDTKTPVTDC
ncbi:hypothetical protein PM082_007390 [Marasmius tenuissimus]|nr:hypothetical protein PM082_007390 [Marasmius tenuissimus]